MKPTFIQLRQTSGLFMWINTNSITAFHSINDSKGRRTYIWLADDLSVEVIETPERILDLIPHP